MRLQATLAQKMITVQSALRSLSVLANLPSDHPIALEASFPNWRTTAERLAENTRLFDVACANSPDLVNAHAAYEKARAEGNAARARQIPWFTSAQAGYSWLNNDTTSQRADGRQTTGATDSDEWEVRLSMTVPVFAWMSSEIKEADANMLAAQLKETAVRQRIQHELTGYVADLKSVTEQKTTYQLQFEKLSPPTEGSTPDMETFYKLSDAYRAAEEEFFMLDMQCAILYGQIMRTLSNWTLTTEHAR
jgi:outer membrane protein TolC